MTFKERLAVLGLASYEEYLAGQHWKEFKACYRQSGRPMRCAVCGRRPIQLHHHAYERLGYELLEDVTPLCRGHHEDVHAWLRKHNQPVTCTASAVSVLAGPAAIILPSSREYERPRRRMKKHRQRTPKTHACVVRKKAKVCLTQAQLDEARRQATVVKQQKDKEVANRSNAAMKVQSTWQETRERQAERLRSIRKR